MKITVKCDCGNEVIIPALAGKYTQFRDYLKTKQFRLSESKIQDGALKEFTIVCDVCKMHIILGID